PMAPTMRDVISRAGGLLVELEALVDLLGIKVTEIASIGTDTLDVIGLRLQDSYEVMAEAIVDRQETLGPAADRVVSSTKVLVSLIAAISVAASVALAILIGRWITVPLQRLARSTRSLSEGNTDIEVTGEQHDHELGQMAKALLVFRDAQVEREALAESAREAKAQQEIVVQSLRSRLEALASGDLRARLETTFPPEYEQLRTDFNAALERMETAIKSVVETSHSIQLGSAEMTNSSEQLSHRTESQAATLEETAAALEQLTGTVRSTSANTDKANAFVDDAKKSAEDSSAVVRQTIDAMGQIQASSEQISQITLMICEICSDEPSGAQCGGRGCARGRGWTRICGGCI
ncbi:MAG: methyl-accepting chemotaxis protein, partial [Pseudomonadota bacterium]